MLTDIVIPYVASRWGEVEIKYMLRSVDKHLSNVGKVYVVGDPVTLKVISVPFEDDVNVVYKERNIFNKLWKMVYDDRVSDPFLFANDDHFLLTDYDAATFPNYYGKRPEGTGVYSHTVTNTLNLIGEGNFYDVHCPMLIHKERFISMMKGVDWNKKCGYCLKTLYGQGLDGMKYGDMKIKLQYPVARLREMIKDRLWFSTHDGARGPDLERLLKELYPVKSRWE